jgi:hypothetical protein
MKLKVDRRKKKKRKSAAGYSPVVLMGAFEDQPSCSFARALSEANSANLAVAMILGSLEAKVSQTSIASSLTPTFSV